MQVMFVGIYQQVLDISMKCKNVFRLVLNYFPYLVLT